MRKVFATVVFSEAQKCMYSLSVVTSSKNIIKLPVDRYKTYTDFQEMYTAVLKTLKNNDMFVGYTEEFNSRVYNIQWIDEIGLTPHLYFYKAREVK